MTDTNSIEFFVDEQRLFFITNGITYPFSEITVEVATMLRKDMERNGADIILEKAGISDYMDQLKNYATCRYGALNLSPDFVNMKSVDSEFYACSESRCRFGQKLCKVIAQYGELTKREQDICRLISEDKSDKFISSDLDISINTVHTHVRNILSKLGEGCTRVKIAVFYAKKATV